MTLKKLQARVNEIIAENERRGWSDRNDLPVIVRVQRRTPTNRVRNRFIPIQYMSSAQLTVYNKKCVELIAEEESEYQAPEPEVQS